MVIHGTITYLISFITTVKELSKVFIPATDGVDLLLEFYMTLTNYGI